MNTLRKWWLGCCALLWSGWLVAQTPTFSHTAGFYSGTLNLELSGPANCTIRYTLTGDSVQASSPVYTGTLPLTHTRVVQARCFPNDGGAPGPVVTQTFLVNEVVTLPVVSLTVAPYHLWDENVGIYVEGPQIDTCNFYPFPCANYWQGWEKPAFVEFFEPGQNRKFGQRTSVEVTGGWSKANPKKGLLLKFDHDVYGGGKVKDWPLMPDKPHLTTWKKLHLRPGGNGQTGLFQHDAWLQRVMRNEHTDYMAYRPAHLFLNGEYWGIYELRERQDAHYVQYNHGVDNDLVDLLRFPASGYYQPVYYYETQEGTDTEWLQTVGALQNLSPFTEAFYTAANEEFDLDNYIDYFAFQTFIGNNDWLGPWMNNIRTWRQQGPTGKWRYMLWDLDGSCGEQWDWGRYTPCFNTIHYARHPEWWSENEHNWMFDKLLLNPQFRDRFVNRYADLLNYTLQPSRMRNLAYQMRDELRPDINRNFNRWWGNTTDWQLRIDNSLSWATARIGCTRQHLSVECDAGSQVLVTLEVKPSQAGKASINSIGPFERTWTGTYFSEVPVSVRVEAASPGWVFSHWESDGEVLLQPDSSHFTQKIGSNSRLTAFFAVSDPRENGTGDPVFVAPNPSADLVFVKADTPLGTCILTNELGQEQLRFSSPQTQYVFSVTGLLPGVYFLKSEGWAKAQRVVVVK